MDLLYRIIIFIHVSSVVISIGPFFILLPIVKKMGHAIDKELSFYIETFRFVVRMTKHAGHVLVGSGVLLVVLSPWTWDTPWILMTIIILFASLFFLARAFSPTLKRFNEEGANHQELATKLKKSIIIYLILLMTMLWFMVVKPYLW
jgi:hypothetical protein